MNDIVDCFSVIIILLKHKLTHGFFDGDETSVVREVAHYISHERCFSGTCCAGIHLRNAMYERYNKEVVYFLCTHFALNELFLGYLAGIDDTDRHGNTDIFAYNKRMNGRNTDILIKESGNKRSGSIEYQLVIMKHTAHYIESVLR